MPIYMLTKPVNVTSIPRGLTARIAGFHPAGPGSTPGVGTKFLFIYGIFFVVTHFLCIILSVIYLHVYTHILFHKLYKFVCATELHEIDLKLD